MHFLQTNKLKPTYNEPHNYMVESISINVLLEVIVPRLSGGVAQQPCAQFSCSVSALLVSPSQ